EPPAVAVLDALVPRHAVVAEGGQHDRGEGRHQQGGGPCPPTAREAQRVVLIRGEQRGTGMPLREMVPEVGLEPTLAEANTALNRARLPIPPLRRGEERPLYGNAESGQPAAAHLD